MAGRYDQDLRLAQQCAEGDEAAWDRFVLDYRPILYRAADALDPSGGARELADSLYADLYGMDERGGRRRSLFRYFHGRSSLATWLRAVLAQRFVDQLRAKRRLQQLPDENDGLHVQLPEGAVATPAAADPDRSRFESVIQEALNQAIANLGDRDRLRLGCYYAQQLSLAEVGQVLHEHEATVSRQLARTRRIIRESVEHHLREKAGLSAEQAAQSIAVIAEDPGSFDLNELLGARKENAPNRSMR